MHFVKLIFIIFIFLRNETIQEKIVNVKPNIIVIIADDLGFNDVSFHGSSQIPTPNIDALAYSGIILNQYYVSPICTPSRSSFFSGMHPIHTGLQHDVIYGTTPFGLPLQFKLLPEYLKDFGYATHLIGKWHLGHFRRKYTPKCRGFDTHYGHWTGHKDYYDNMAEESKPEAWGYDMRRNFETTYENFGEYTTDLYTEEAKKVIEKHPVETPLFLVVSHTAVHSANPYNLLQAPYETVSKYSYIKDINRRIFAAMVDKMDESVGDVVSALKNKNMLKNSIIIFTTDNGGPAAGFNFNAASNWPLRGVKNTLWEGGVRGAALLWSPLIKSSSRVSNQLIHIQDWLPTLIRAIGEDPTILGKIDGLDLWEAINEDHPSQRSEILHNIDNIYGNRGLRYGDWKLLRGTTYSGRWDGWYGPSGSGVNNTQNHHISSNNDSNFLEIIANSKTGEILSELKLYPKEDEIKKLRNNAKIICKRPEKEKNCNLLSNEYCLFNIKNDPCEYENLAYEEPNILNLMKNLMDKYEKSSTPPINKPKDDKGYPKFWNYTWTNWMDYLEPNLSSINCPCC